MDMSTVPTHLHLPLNHVRTSTRMAGGGGYGGGPSGDLDVTAAELVNRLSFHARQDMEQVRQMAGSAINKLSNMAGRFMNDLSRY
jgi:hypothetical protein